MVSYYRLWCYDANMISSYCCDISVVAVVLTRWGRVTHIYVGKLTIIGSDNGLSPGGRQAIIRTNAGISLIGPLGTNFSEILIEILTFSFKKMRLKVSSAKRWPFCPGLNVLISPAHLLCFLVSNYCHVISIRVIVLINSLWPSDVI